MERNQETGFPFSMETIVRRLARWRFQMEIRFKSQATPSLTIGIFVGSMITAIIWTFKAGLNQSSTACDMGIAAFGGMFLIACISVGALLARMPVQIIEELGRAGLDLPEPMENGTFNRSTTVPRRARLKP